MVKTSRVMAAGALSLATCLASTDLEAQLFGDRRFEDAPASRFAPVRPRQILTGPARPRISPQQPARPRISPQVEPPPILSSPQAPTRPRISPQVEPPRQMGVRPDFEEPPLRAEQPQAAGRPRLTESPWAARANSVGVKPARAVAGKSARWAKPALLKRRTVGLARASQGRTRSLREGDVASSSAKMGIGGRAKRTAAARPIYDRRESPPEWDEDDPPAYEPRPYRGVGRPWPFYFGTGRGYFGFGGGLYGR